MFAWVWVCASSAPNLPASYDGVEIRLEGFINKYGREKTPESVMVFVREQAALQGVRVFGGTWQIHDHQWEEPGFLENLAKYLVLNKEMGAEYASFQLSLRPDHLRTGGMYRHDDEYLALTARRIDILHDIVHQAGLNFYVETHVDRVTEDIEAFCGIMDRANYFELNGDLSHYIIRGISAGDGLARIMKRVHHTHQRIARTFGDISVNVPDPAEDWANWGPTFNAFQYSSRAFDHGLSSRTIVGESGPIHLVTDPLAVDASLVPLWRAMAEYCDDAVRGRAPVVKTPRDLRPWG